MFQFFFWGQGYDHIWRKDFIFFILYLSRSNFKIKILHRKQSVNILCFSLSVNISVIFEFWWEVFDIVLNALKFSHSIVRNYLLFSWTIDYFVELKVNTISWGFLLFLKLFTIFWTCLLPEIQTFLTLNSTKLLTIVSFILRQMTVCKLIWGINIEVIILPSPNEFLFFIKLYSVIKYCLR